MKPVKYSLSDAHKKDLGAKVVYAYPTDANKLLKVPSDKSIIWHIPDKDEIYEDIKANFNSLLTKYLANPTLNP